MGGLYRNCGKMQYSVAICRSELAQGRKVLIACLNQKAGLDYWRAVMPECLFELVGSYYIRPHLKKGKP